MKHLLVATTNPAKLAEYQVLLRDFELKLISLREVGIAQAAPEDATSFSENARLKAAFYFDLAGIPTLADDGGLEVDALNGAPGVRSHRWLGIANPDDRMLAEGVIRRMTGVAPERRTARIRTAAALIWVAQTTPTFSGKEGVAPTRCERIAEAALEGMVADHCYRDVRPGFPYRSVLWLPQRGCYLAELSEEEAAQLSQRRTLIQQLSAELTNLAATAA